MFNYTSLQTAVRDLAEDDSSEFNSFLPTAISLAEDRLYRVMDIDFSKESVLSTVNNDARVTMPTDLRVTHNVYIVVNQERKRLINKTEDFIKDYWPFVGQTEVPKYYTERDLTTWLLAPTPDGVYNLEVEYEAAPLKLSATNPENILSTKYSDLLLYAVMSNISEWMKDDERKGVWEEKLNEALSSTNNEGMRQRHDDNTNVNNPVGGRNTKVKNGV